ELARDATRESVRMSPHRATHAASAEAHCLAPAGRFEELIEVTPRVVDVVREEGGRLCRTGSVGPAGRALALHERGERTRRARPSSSSRALLLRRAWSTCTGSRSTCCARSPARSARD